MAQNQKDDPSTYPALGRWMTWVDKPGSGIKILWALILICIGVFALEWTYEKKSHFGAEDIKGFYAFYGFVMFTILILAAKGLRVLIKRPEDYYGDKAVDTEEYPDDQLDKRDHGDV